MSTKQFIRIMALLILCNTAGQYAFGQYDFSISLNCQNLQVNPLFGDSDNYDYLWAFGDGSISTLYDPTPPPHAYADDGTYVVCLSVFSASTSTLLGGMCHVVEVYCCNPLPPVAIQLNIPSAGECDTNIPMSILPGGIADPNDYCVDWDFGDGGGTYDEEVYTGVAHNYDCAGSYEVTVTVKCCADSSVFTIKTFIIDITCPCFADEIPYNMLVAYLPGTCNIIASVGTSASFCENWDICFRFIWGDGTFTDVDDGSASHTYPTAGTYIIRAHIYCCSQPGGGQYIYREITVTCDCTAPDASVLSINLLDDAGIPGCEDKMFSLDYPNGWNDTVEEDYCVQWTFDGEPMLLPMPLSATPSWNFCNGYHEVCVTVYCCENPSESVTVCENFWLFGCVCLPPPTCIIFPFVYSVPMADGTMMLHFNTYFGEGTIGDNMHFQIVDINDVVVHEGFGNNPDNICIIVTLPNGDYSILQTVTAHMDGQVCDATIATPLVVDFPSCSVFPSFYTTTNENGVSSIYPTTEFANNTLPGTQQIVITDEFNVPVYQSWCTADWWEPDLVPELPDGNYIITMTTTGMLGGNTCSATHEEPLQIFGLPGCTLYPSFYIDQYQGDYDGFQSTTSLGENTQLVSEELTITDAENNIVFNQLTDDGLWLFVTLPSLPAGDYEVSLTVTGQLGSETCVSSAIQPLTIAASCPSDLDENGTVNISDMLLFLSDFGSVCGQ